MKTISIQDIPRNSADAVIIDVRTPAEHAEAHLQRAHEHVPIDTLSPRDFMMRRGLDNDVSVYILCRSGGRATTAANRFADEGYTNVYVIDGGILAAESAGETVIRNKPANDSAEPAINVEKAKNALNGFYAKLGKYPLDRQVMMIVGGVIVLSMLLGFADLEIFYVVPLLAGGALFYKGLTGFCMGEKIIAKAPWNKNNPAPFCSTINKSGTGGCA